jgi:hypothetical protein
MQLDKITHSLAGAAIAVAMLPWGVIPALLAVVVAAVGKELWDAYAALIKWRVRIDTSNF